MEKKPTIYNKGELPQELYSGVPTFMGLPKAEKKEDFEGHDIVVMGAPWEGGCTYGGYGTCMLATKTIRDVSTRYVGYLPEFDLDTFDYLSGCDYGDCAIRNGDYEFTFGEIRKKIADILDMGKFPITFGGDHSIGYPLISEMAKRHKKRVGVIHFDAHMDNMPAFGDDPYSRCSSFRRLYEDENMDATKIVHLGIRGPRNHYKEGASAKEFGANVITTLEIKKIGYEAAIKKALELARKDTDVIYVTICSDVLDAASNPEGPVDPCGLTTFELAMMLHECGLAGVDALDYVEISPEVGGHNASAHAAVWMTLYLLNGLAERKRNNEKHD